MSERYTKLFSLQENLYDKNCPVMICAGALSKDNQTSKVFAQLRLQNVDSQHRTLVAVKVAIQAFDVAEKMLGKVKDYQYLDVKIQKGAEFGSKLPVYLDDITTRSFSVSVLEVVFEDGCVWTGTTQDWCSLQQTMLEDKFSADLLAQYRRETFAQAKYEPLAKDNVWLCACGALNTTEDSFCCRCHHEKAKQFSSLDRDMLADKLRKLADIELEEQAKKEAEARKRQQKGIRIGLIALLVVCLCISVSKIIANIRYAPYRPYVDELVGTTWYLDGENQWTFTEDNTFKTSYFDLDTDAHVYREIFVYGTWEILDIAHRQYSVGSESFSGDAMRIELMGKDESEKANLDIWIIDNGTILVLSPEESSACTFTKVQDSDFAEQRRQVLGLK